MYRNLWTPDWQSDIIKCIGDHYHFSTRLQHSIIGTGTRPPQNKHVESEKANDAGDDLERGLNGNSKAGTSGAGGSHSKDFGMHDLVRENMNYTSIDRGNQCTNETQPRTVPAS